MAGEMDQAFWDARYGRQRIWSGDPNGALVDETGDMPPGRALDLGCGEGDDARWLAARGWDVVAVDISRVAVDRARALGPDNSDHPIEWVCADIVGDGVPVGPYDLISMQYFPLLRVPDDPPMRAVLDAVAAGGTLLVVAHDLTHMHDHDGPGARDWDGPDPAEMYQPDDIARLLDDGRNGAWDVAVRERRPRRHAGTGSGAHHVADVVLRALRRS